ncbi:hypothetical protein AWM75_00575 [Aerococcus urinaehominis]|uniref:Uncharacterized protein n=2 Tax=Aerococcus urinaehominis TaxID=128944 RepID=A0A0X8FJV8_9LACT|nr:hypothetical protein AWM75_00575 [Aerococcus urinaehominis]SDL77312.1 zinc-ribbon domain-containing protein [Aerococcus urinaehominis]
MYCQNCGQEVPAESNFCIHCGHALKDEGQAVANPSRFNQAGAKFSQVSQDLINRVDRVTGGSGQVKIKFSDLFTEIGKRHQRDEVDEIFTAGSRLTTPAPEDISKEWPRPWYYSRIFIVLMLVALALYVVTVNMDNMITLPALLLVGASVTVLPVVSFFF